MLWYCRRASPTKSTLWRPTARIRGSTTEQKIDENASHVLHYISLKAAVLLCQYEVGVPNANIVWEALMMSLETYAQEIPEHPYLCLSHDRHRTSVEKRLATPAMRETALKTPSTQHPIALSAGDPYLKHCLLGCSNNKVTKTAGIPQVIRQLLGCLASGQSNFVRRLQTCRSVVPSD